MIAIRTQLEVPMIDYSVSIYEVRFEVTLRLLLVSGSGGFFGRIEDPIWFTQMLIGGEVTVVGIGEIL